MKTPGARFSEFLKKEKIDQKTMASLLRVSQSFVSQLTKDESLIRTSLLQRIVANYPSFNTDYYITGRGEVCFEMERAEDQEGQYLLKDELETCKTCIHHVRNKYLKKENNLLQGQIAFLQNVVQQKTS